MRGPDSSCHFVQHWHAAIRRILPAENHSVQSEQYKRIFHQGKQYQRRNTAANKAAKVPHLEHISFESVSIVHRLLRVPNEDICLFQDFPHSHLVYPFVFPEKKIECTCTLKWLHLNVGHLRILYHALDDDYFNGENSSNVFYYGRIECDFVQMFAKCSPPSHHPSGIRNDVDLFFLIKWLE